MLRFNVFNQRLIRIDQNNPATDSVEYLEAQFTFNTDDWNGKAKSAIFTKGTSSYTVLLDSKGVCKVPFEVLQSNESSKLLGNTDKISVSLVGIYDTCRITTNEVKINLNYSGYSEGQEPSEPTAEMYEQILTAYADAEAKCEETQQALNLYSNAIKGNVSGTTVTADDVSPIEHEVSVNIYGKNLFNKNIYVVMEETLMFDISKLKEGQNYVLSSNKPITWFKISNYPSSYNSVAYSDKNGMYEVQFTMARNKNIPIDKTQYLLLSVVADYQLNPVKSLEELDDYNIQIEKGSIVTDYEPYIDPTNTIVTAGNETFTALSNGIVEGIKSTALAKGITTDAEGMTIDVEYNKDINVVLNKISDALGIEI